MRRMFYGWIAGMAIAAVISLSICAAVQLSDGAAFALGAVLSAIGCNLGMWIALETEKL